MALDASFLSNLNPATGIVVVVFGNEEQAGATIQRAPDAAGSPGAYSTIAVLDSVDPAGTAFLDTLPLDNTFRWYRAFQSEIGFDNGPTSLEYQAKPTIIADPDFTNKPWLNDGVVPLRLVMSTVSETTTTLTVSSSVNSDPARRGIPTVSVLSAAGVAVPTLAGGTWAITKPASGSGTVIFQNALTGRIAATYTVTLGNQNADVQYTNCVATVTSASAAQIMVQVTGSAPTGTPLVRFMGVSGGTTLASGSAIGVSVSSGASWIFNRGAPLSGSGQAVFQSLLAGYQSDNDQVEIPEQGRDTVPLQLVATVLNTSPSASTVRLTASNPVTTTNTGLITVITALNTTVTPSTPQAVAAAGGTVDYVVTRPAFQSGTGRATWRYNSSGSVSDTDSQDIAAQERDTVTPNLVLTPTTQSSTQYIFDGAAYNPVAGGVAPTITITVVGTTGRGGLDPAGTYVMSNPFTGVQIDRPPFGTTTQATYTLSASIAGGGSTSIQRSVANQVKTTFGPSLDVTSFDSSGFTQMNYTASTGTVQLSIDAGTYFTAPASPIVTARPTYGNLPIKYTYKATDDGQTVVATVFIMPQDNTAITIAFSSFTAIVNSFATDDFHLTWGIGGISPPAGAYFEAWIGVDTDAPGIMTTFTGATLSGNVPSGYDLVSGFGTLRAFNIYLRLVTSGGVSVLGQTGTITVNTNTNP